MAVYAGVDAQYTFETSEEVRCPMNLVHLVSSPTGILLFHGPATGKFFFRLHHHS